MDIVESNKIEEKRIVARGFHLHTEYKSGNDWPSDIAIVYWDKPLKMDEWGISPICLPESGIINNGLEYGKISGWGVTDLNGSLPTFLPMGWVVMLPPFNNDTDHNNEFVLAKWTPYPEGTVICRVCILTNQ